MINLDDVKQLVAQGDAHTLSIYLGVDDSKPENQTAQPAWRIFLKHAINESESVAKQTKGWLQTKARFDAFFENYTADSKGLAVFFTPESEQIYELPVPVDTAWHFGKPVVVPLLWAIDEYEPYLIVMVNQEKAELLTAYLGNTTIEDKLENEMYQYDFEQKTLMPATEAVAGGHPITAGSNREAYQNLINEHIAQFHRDVLAHVEEQIEKHPHIRLVIGGEERSAHALRNLLPKSLEDSFVALLSIPMHSTSHQIWEQVLPDALAYERGKELALVNQVIDFAKAGGRGALGRKAVDEALTMQRVETLLLPWPIEDQVEGTKLSARAFESGGSVELVRDAAADRLNQEGGIAARLYYTLEKT